MSPFLVGFTKKAKKEEKREPLGLWGRSGLALAGVVGGNILGALGAVGAVGAMKQLEKLDSRLSPADAESFMKNVSRDKGLTTSYRPNLLASGAFMPLENAIQTELSPTAGTLAHELGHATSMRGFAGGDQVLEGPLRRYLSGGLSNPAERKRSRSALLKLAPMFAGRNLMAPAQLGLLLSNSETGDKIAPYVPFALHAPNLIEEGGASLRALGTLAKHRGGAKAALKAAPSLAAAFGSYLAAPLGMTLATKMYLNSKKSRLEREKTAMAEPSKSDLKALLQKHEDRETPEQEKAESEEEQKEERAAGLHEKSAFWDGFEKRALNLATARAAMGRFKDKLIRRAPKLNMGSLSEHMEGKTPKEKLLSLSKDKLSTGGAPLRGMGPAMNAQSTVSSHPQANLKTFAQGDALKDLKGFGMDVPAMDRSNKEMTNRMMHLHEQAERKSFGKAKTMWAGAHADPRVILEEGNMLATLPKGHEATKEVFHTLRGEDSTKALLEAGLPGYEYGKTRLSRHGVKHMRRILEGKGMQAVPFPGTEIKKVAFWDGFSAREP
ncbi:MAG: hypothetical protein MUP21_05440 [Dehalococcoidia bacterium]|nr:hypothetical protein [Dehalococcoidia bacterium]